MGSPGLRGEKGTRLIGGCIVMCRAKVTFDRCY